MMCLLLRLLRWADNGLYRTIFDGVKNGRGFSETTLVKTCEMVEFFAFTESFSIFKCCWKRSVERFWQ